MAGNINFAAIIITQPQTSSFTYFSNTELVATMNIVAIIYWCALLQSVFVSNTLLFSRETKFSQNNHLPRENVYRTHVNPFYKLTNVFSFVCV